MKAKSREKTDLKNLITQVKAGNKLPVILVRIQRLKTQLKTCSRTHFKKASQHQNEWLKQAN
jgi:hypothetical protein